MTAAVEIQLIGAVVALSCAILGVFLILRRMAMMSDAISHTVLLGIVLGFFIFRDLNSPWLIISAAGMGVLTVSMVELINRTKLIKQDASIGIVFPALFSIAVILISRFARGVHLDSDAVLLGELAFAPFDRAIVLGVDLPRGLVVMGIILLIDLLFVILFFKELKIATFDAGLAAALGFSPALVHYLFMALVSVTAVGAFDAVGSILVVALMTAPAAAAYLLTDNLVRMLVISAALGIVSAIGGYWLAIPLDANIAGSMATMAGLVFLTAFLLAPNRGMVALALRRRQQRWDFAQTALTIHLLQHENTPAMAEECRVDHLHYHLHWEPNFAVEVVDKAVRNGFVDLHSGDLSLTEHGRSLANKVLIHA